MEKNIGQKDKTLRLSTAAVLALVALFTNLGPLDALLWLAVTVLVVTSVVGFCPAYILLKMNTCDADKACCGGDKSEKTEEDKAA